MTGNLSVFLRGENQYLGYRRVADGTVSGAVFNSVKAHARPRQTCANRCPHLAIVFANTACKNDKINPTQSGHHRGYLLASE